MKINKFFFAIVALFLFACQQGNKQSAKAVQQATLNDTISTAPAHQQKAEPVTPRYMALIRHIDSAGYIFDTVRYPPSEGDVVRKINNYVFYEVAKESTIPFRVFAMIEEQKKEAEEQKKKARGNEEIPLCTIDMGDFDIKPLEQTQRVMQYYFKQKQPQIIGGQKWYTDGIIEEWTFGSEQQAQAAAKALMNTELCIMYFNTCAFVCSADKQLYIFFSRAAGFMYTQKDFFNWFVNQNNMPLYTKSNL